MRSASVFLLAIKFFLLNFGALMQFLLLPLIFTLALFAALIAAAYKLIEHLPAILGISSEGFLAQGMVMGSQVLGTLLTIFFAYLFFVPIWQLLISLWLEDLSYKVCRLYALQNNIVLKRINHRFFISLWVSVKISLAIFIRQIAIRIFLLMLIFLNPAFGIFGFAVEFIANYFYASYEYFYPPIVNFKAAPKNFAHLKEIIKSGQVPFSGFRFWAALCLSIPLVNIFAAFLNIIAAAILFCTTPNRHV